MKPGEWIPKGRFADSRLVALRLRSGQALRPVVLRGRCLLAIGCAHSSPGLQCGPRTLERVRAGDGPGEPGIVPLH